jgi:hypothetical protein
LPKVDEIVFNTDPTEPNWTLRAVHATGHTGKVDGGWENDGPMVLQAKFLKEPVISDYHDVRCL